MFRTSAPSANQTVSSAIARSGLMAGHRPLPLVATAYDIRIFGGLADIVAKRTFHNAETGSIEATLTFPLPVHAVLYHLEARIGDRVVKARARARTDARAEYEAAIDRGKTAVLHEELIRGVHLISVGHIPPGTQIEITARLVLSLSHIAGRVFLRLPTTVGDVYGASGLPDCDDLVHGGAPQAAEVRVACDHGTPLLAGGALADGAARLSLDAPIVVEVADWRPATLAGVAADGRVVRLDIVPAARGSGSIDAAVLIDRSGSMDGPCAAGKSLSKHAAALLGLSAAAADFVAGDRLALFEFDDVVGELGSCDAAGWPALLASAGAPRGGTEIGGAIADVIARSKARDILLVTDGKSYAIDVQALAGAGRRITVVLIGEDSLDANVGHLATLTGGDILVPDGTDVSGAMRGALGAIRLAGDPREQRLRRGGMALTASWQAEKDAAGCADAEASRAVAAFAASLLLSSLGESDARQLAEAEGLVTHLTSLVLVDEDGATQVGLPAMRKVALPSPAGIAAAAACAAPSMSLMHARSGLVLCEKRCISRSVGLAEFDDEALVARKAALRDAAKPKAAARAERTGSPTSPAAPSVAVDLAPVVRRIDWTALGTTLATGSLVGVEADIADLIRRASALTQVRKTAKRLGIAPLMLVVALLARVAAVGDRHADRVARTVLGNALPQHLSHAARRLGLAAAGSQAAE